MGSFVVCSLFTIPHVINAGIWDVVLSVVMARSGFFSCVGLTTGSISFVAVLPFTISEDGNFVDDIKISFEIKGDDDVSGLASGVCISACFVGGTNSVVVVFIVVVVVVVGTGVVVVVGAVVVGTGVVVVGVVVGVVVVNLGVVTIF